MKSACLVFVALSCCAIAVKSEAQSFPSKAVRIVVPYTAGGGTDLVARILAEGLARGWSTPVVVENRPGATGNIGSEFVARSPADGYTLLIVTGGDVAMTSAVLGVSYDPARDLAPIAPIVASNLGLFAHPSIGVRSMAALVEKAKAEPGKLAYGSCGSGSPQHLAGEMVKQAARIDLVHVPYKSCGPAQVGAVSGEVQFVVTAAGNMVPQVKAGKVVALAVTGPTRHPQLPDVPTMMESGFAGFSLVNWMGLFAPAKTPAGIVAKINADVRAQFSDPAFAKKIVERGFEPLLSTPEELHSRIERDRELFQRMAKSVGARAD